MDRVVVTVTGVQRDLEGQENRIELVTVGKHYEKNGVHYITYNETQLSGMEGTTTLIKLFADHVAVVRMGSVEHKQEFRLEEKTYSTYVTPYGTLKMAAITSRLEFSYGNAKGQVYVEYELEIEGQPQSLNVLAVTIREE